MSIGGPSRWRMRTTLPYPISPNVRPRASFLALLNETIRVGERREPLSLALHTSAASLCRALTGGDRTLALPEGLPVKPDLVDAAEAVG